MARSHPAYQNPTPTAQMEGVTPEALRSAQREASDAARRLAAAELELRAAQDSLEVYRRADAAAKGSGGADQHGALSGARGAARGGSSPDEGKTEAEVGALHCLLVAV